MAHAAPRPTCSVCQPRLAATSPQRQRAGPCCAGPAPGGHAAAGCHCSPPGWPSPACKASQRQAPDDVMFDAFAGDMLTGDTLSAVCWTKQSPWLHSSAYIAVLA